MNRPKGALILYRHQKESMDPTDHDNSGENSDSIIILSYWGASEEKLKKKYGYLGPIFKKNILAIPCRGFFVFFEKLTYNWIKSSIDWFKSRGLLDNANTLVVSSAGGSAMYIHFMRWYAQQQDDDKPVFNRIMWENCPGSMTYSEFYRAVLRVTSLNDTMVTRIFILPLIFVFYGVYPLLSTFPERTRKAPHLPELLPRDLIKEYCLANDCDPITEYSFLLWWRDTMGALGRKINLITFKSNGHLDLHKTHSEEYLKVWNNFLSPE